MKRETRNNTRRANRLFVTLLLVVVALLWPAEHPGRAGETEEISSDSEMTTNEAKNETPSREAAIELARLLTEEREALQKKEDELETARRELATYAEELEKLAEDLEKKLQSAPTSAAISEGSAENRLADIYRRLKPENSAAALKELYADDPQAAVEIVSSMKSRDVGRILDSMAESNPDLVASITERMRGSGGRDAETREVAEPPEVEESEAVAPTEKTGEGS